MTLSRRPFIIAALLSLVSLVFIGIVYPRLPSPMPVHWNWRGEVDGWGPRWTIFLLGALPLALVALFRMVPKIDPRGDSYEKHERAYQVLVLAVPLLLIAVTWLSIAVALGATIRIEVVVPILVGLLFILIGNFMPQIRFNYSFGIRLPWTLASEESWRRTHRLGGYVFIALGMVFVATSLLPVPAGPKWLVALAVFISLLGYLFLYAYRVWKNDKDKKAIG